MTSSHFSSHFPKADVVTLTGTLRLKASLLTVRQLWLWILLTKTRVIYRVAAVLETLRVFNCLACALAV